MIAIYWYALVCITCVFFPLIHVATINSGIMKSIKYDDWYVEWWSGYMLILNGHHNIVNTHGRNFLIESVVLFHVFNASKISLFEYLCKQPKIS